MIEHRTIMNLVLSNLTSSTSGTGRVGQSASHAFDASIEETYLAFATGATLVAMSDDVVRLGPDLVPFCGASGSRLSARLQRSCAWCMRGPI